MTHALTFMDRGLEHVHRWVPSCSCGWKGVQRRRKDEGIKQYRMHVKGLDLLAKTQAAGTRPKPRKPTPVGSLPEALR